MYQGTSLVNYTERASTSCCDMAKEDLANVSRRMKERLEWSDTDLLKAVLTFLDTQASCRVHVQFLLLITTQRFRMMTWLM